jgi:hypothetical protein
LTLTELAGSNRYLQIYFWATIGVSVNAAAIDLDLRLLPMACSV